MNIKKFQKVFPLGSHLCREPMPTMEELKKDMENLKKHGFNLIKLQEHWMINEPLEGYYDFSKYEELIQYAEKLDLGICLGLTCEQAPGWLYEKYPDCHMVGRNGVPIVYEAQCTLPSDGKPGPCFDHLGARADMLRFIKKLVETLSNYENIVIWNTWQEIGYWADALVGQPVCYCPYTISFFREWLREKYGSLDELNKAWNTRYLNWKYVTPDRNNQNYFVIQNIDWNYFMSNVQVARILKSRAEVIKKNDPFKRPVFAHKGAPQIGSGMDWTYAQCQDFLGSSTYPAWGPGHPWDDNAPGWNSKKHSCLLSEIYDGIVLKFDYLRSCNASGKPVWAAEFQGGPVSSGLHKGRVPSSDDIRRWMLSAIGSDVTGISFWVTRAEILTPEINGFSLLDSTGDTTERFEEASRIGLALNKYPELFGKPADRTAQVVILIDEINFQGCQMLEKANQHLFYSVRGWHRMLWESNISVDFINTLELGEEYIHDYSLIILPFPIFLSEETAEKLTHYVQQGGNLISSACPGRINEHGFCNRGELSPKMKALFGVEHKTLTLVREPGNGRRWSFPERTWGEYVEPAMLKGTGLLQGNKLRANFYLETFKCVESEPCLMYNGSIAGTLRKVGKSKSYLLGTFPGHSGTAYRSEETRKTILKLLSQCGITPEYKGQLLLRKRICLNKQAWIFTNIREKTVTEKIKVKGWARVENLLGEELKQNNGTITLKVKPLDVVILVLQK